MATTKCPYCAEEIQSEAIKCKHCGCWLANPPAGPIPAVNPVVGPRPARLTRSSTNRMVSGVCGGIGQYLGIDATLVRILVAVASFFTAIFPGVVLYILFSFVIPSDDAPTTW